MDHTALLVVIKDKGSAMQEVHKKGNQVEGRNSNRTYQGILGICHKQENEACVRKYW